MAAQPGLWIYKDGYWWNGSAKVSTSGAQAQTTAITLTTSTTRTTKG